MLHNNIQIFTLSDTGLRGNEYKLKNHVLIFMRPDSHQDFDAI